MSGRGRLLYIYTNGFVLPNVPDIEGGILSNDSARYYDLWLRENPTL